METFGFGPTFSSVADDVINGAKSVSGKILDAIDPRSARLQLAGLVEGGAKKTASTVNSRAKFSDSDIDWRVKISLAKDATYFYNTGIDAGLLEPLRASGGVIFPYTPTISVSHAARYSSQSLTHSNYTNYSYEGSEVQQISIAGDFTAQNNIEAAYVLACIQFFRAATKMWFGSGERAGNPPPVVFLNGYGSHYFPNVPCVVTSFQHTMPADVDYISAITTSTNGYSAESRRVTSYPGEDNQSSAEDRRLGLVRPAYSPVSKSTNAATTMIPTTSTLTINLQPIYSRKNVFSNSNLDKFAKGDLIGDPKTGQGGFI